MTHEDALPKSGTHIYTKQVHEQPVMLSHPNHSIGPNLHKSTFEELISQNDLDK